MRRHLPNVFLKKKSMTAKVGNKTALEKEYILFEKDGIEIYVDTNMEIHARLTKC